MKRRFVKLLVVFLLFRASTPAQETLPFAGEIAAFKRQDSMAAPSTGQILFTGSSSFTLWKDVQDYFPGYPIMNRGFGGSSLTDLLRYEKDIIFPYRPKQVVIYCGENDIAASDSVTGEMVFNRFKQLFSDIRNVLPGTHVMYISMKPSPSRWHMRERMRKGNELIERFLRKQHKTKFINVWKPMLGSDGKPVHALFLDDMLHMNKSGYMIWQKMIQPELIK
jgi:lysophospholipase L1-like esterase